jgi:acyl-coenzyme A synthetase/AMP-(fatty) acid ligase
VSNIRTACAFYDLKLIILPFEPKTSDPAVIDLLKRASPDVLIMQGGQLPLDQFKDVGLKEIILVVEQASQHLDWKQPVGPTKCARYDEVVSQAAEPIADLDLDLNAPAVIIFGPKIAGKVDMVEFSHRVCPLRPAPPRIA